MMNYFQLLSLMMQHSILSRRKRRRRRLDPSSNLFVLFTSFYLCSIVSCADIGKYFTRNPSSLVAPPGDRVTFECETNIPAEQMRWKLNGRFLETSNESDIQIKGNFLTFKVSEYSEKYLQQVGDYQCVAEFGAEALTSIQAQLSIARIDAFQPRNNQTLQVVEGSSVAIVCDAPYSNPIPIIQFYKDEISIESEVGNAVLLDSGILHLHNVSYEDSGNYWCTATNHITTETFAATSATLLIVHPQFSTPRRAPEFVVKPKTPFVAPQDGNVTLECAAIGNPPPFTTWRKLRGTIANGQKSVKGNMLHLYNIGISQEGDYICEAYNGVGDSLTSLTTVVLNSLPNITKEPISLVVEEGGNASMDCLVEGLPKPRVYWVFNGANVQEDGNLQIIDTGLKIANVEKKHAGLFQCFATNPMGTVTSPAELKVLPKQITAMANDSTDFEDPRTSILPPVTRHHHHDHHHKNNKFHRGKHNKRRKHKGQDMIPPSKPHMNRISDESVMVRWSVPENNGYPIQFFKIQYKELSSKGGGRWMTIDDDIPPHISSYEVGDLRVGHAYKFRIAAVYSNNDNKVGEVSEKFLLQRDTSMRRPVAPPVITTAAPHNTTTIILRWKHMTAPAGAVDGYFIYYREGTSAGDYSKVTVLGPNADHHYITHLKPGTSYDIKVQGFNKAGASNFSSIVPAKTLGPPPTEKPEEGKGGKHDKELIIPDDLPHKSSSLVYVLLGCGFVGFWIFLCVGCLVCYKCKRRRPEDEPKYPCDIPASMDPKPASNGHAQTNGRGSTLNGYIPTIAAHIALDEKETSFVERHNNNRPISPSQLNTSTCDLESFRLASLDMRSWTEMKPVRTLERDREKTETNNSRNSSLQRKKYHNHANSTHNHNHQNNLNYNNHNNHFVNPVPPSVSIGSNITNGGLGRVRGPYMSCSSDELEIDLENDHSINIKDTKIFPKEHYKSRKHSLTRSKRCGIAVEG